VEVSGVDDVYKADPSANVTLQGSVLGPVVPSKQVCLNAVWDDAPVKATIGPVRVDHDGVISDLGMIQAESVGCYNYVWTMTATVEGVVLWSVTHGSGVVDQIVQVTPPTVATQTSEQVANLGAVIFDTIEVGGFDEAGAPVGTEMVIKLYGPLPAPQQDCTLISESDWREAIEADPQLLEATERVEVVGNGQIVSSGVKVLRPGCHTWVEQLRLPDQSLLVETPPGIAEETTLAASPGVTTQISASVAGVGYKITDEIVVTGLVGPAVIVAKIVGPVIPDGNQPCGVVSKEIWDAALATGQLTELAAEHINIDGSGTYTTSPVLPTAGGCWTWIVSLVLGEVSEPVWMVDLPAGIGSETVKVIEPRVGTVAQSTSGTTEIYDIVKVEGLAGQKAVISGYVLGPGEPDTTKEDICEDVDWGNAPKHADVAPLEIEGNGVYKTAAIPVTASGCYTFVEHMEVEYGLAVDAHDGKPGVVSETMYLKPPPGPFPTAKTGGQLVGNHLWTVVLSSVACAVMAVVAWANRHRLDLRGR
jgi:hypothetical protein